MNDFEIRGIIFLKERQRIMEIHMLFYDKNLLVKLQDFTIT